jgi:hypothetical protein
MGTTDDPAGAAKTMAVPPNFSPLVHLVAATPFLISVLNGVAAGALAAIVAASLGAPLPSSAIAGVAGFGLVLATQLAWARRNVQRLTAGYRPLYPSRTQPR